MKGAASALLLALGLVGCGTQWWCLDLDCETVGDASMDGSTEPAEAMSESGDEGPSIGGCRGDPDCTQPGSPHCDLDARLCVECVENRQCTVPNLLLCNLSSHRCVGCFSTPKDTCNSGQVCQQTQCVYLCPDGGGCPSGLKCNTAQSRFLCVQCFNNADCAEARAGTYCDTSSGTCMEGIGSLPPSGDDGQDGGGLLDSGDGAMSDGSVSDAPDASE